MATTIKTIAFIAALGAVSVANAQAEDKNLVKNPGFENTQGKLKKDKSIAVAKEWTSPTAIAADLYSNTSKEILSSATGNPYGSEEPMAGSNFAGVVMYSFQDKSPRTYISTELMGPLKKGMK